MIYVCSVGICNPAKFSTFHLQLSFGVPPVGPRVVHSNVIQRGLLDDEGVLPPVLLKAILGGGGIFVKFNVLKEPGKSYLKQRNKGSRFETCRCQNT